MSVINDIMCGSLKLLFEMFFLIQKCACIKNFGSFKRALFELVLRTCGTITVLVFCFQLLNVLCKNLIENVLSALCLVSCRVVKSLLYPSIRNYYHSVLTFADVRLVGNLKVGMEKALLLHIHHQLYDCCSLTTAQLLQWSR